jgi:hypothetical protein
MCKCTVCTLLRQAGFIGCLFTLAFIECGLWFICFAVYNSKGELDVAAVVFAAVSL